MNYDNLAHSEDHIAPARSTDGRQVDTLGDLLLKCQSELTDIANLIEAAEQVLCGPETSTSTVAASNVVAVQGMDLAIQKVHGLGEFLAELSSTLPQQYLIDTTTALNVVKLADMQRRLRTSLQNQEPDSDPVNAGDIDLF